MWRRGECQINYFYLFCIILEWHVYVVGFRRHFCILCARRWQTTYFLFQIFKFRKNYIANFKKNVDQLKKQNNLICFFFKIEKKQYSQHCVKIVPIWSYSGLHFPARGLNNSEYGHFLRSPSQKQINEDPLIKAAHCTKTGNCGFGHIYWKNP